MFLGVVGNLIIKLLESICLAAYNYMSEVEERVNEFVRVYFCSGGGKEMG